MKDTVYGTTGDAFDPKKAKEVATTTGKQGMLDSIKEYEEKSKKWEEKPVNKGKRRPVSGPREWGGWVCEKCVEKDGVKEYSYRATTGQSVVWPQGAVGSSGIYAAISPLQYPKCDKGDIIVASWHTHAPMWVPTSGKILGYYSNSVGTNQEDRHVMVVLGLKYAYVVLYERGVKGQEPIIKLAE